MNGTNYWYKNSVIYGIKIDRFKDGNGDGIGDFIGLREKLDYLLELGIDCIWLLPFYKHGGGDNGYDVVDYCSIDPDYGTFDEFKLFLAEAKKRGIKVIIDLVVQHTSDKHPWFLEAISDPDSKYHDYYIWTKKIPSGSNHPPGFPGKDDTVWWYEETIGQYYYHTFYHFEPDLNTANPLVQEEIFGIMDFWLSFSIDGFRIDAATILFSEKGNKRETKIADPGSFMHQMHSFIIKKRPDGIMLAEADVDEKKIKLFFGKGDRMQLLYNFILNRYIFLSLARQDAKFMHSHLKKIPTPPEQSQWVNFIRNLDELNIGTLEKDYQEDIYRAFGPDSKMKIFGRGLRRRIASMLGGNILKQKMVFSLMFSLPGAALFVYGDEIGMGEKLELAERESVRTIMQWTGDDNAGFSESDDKNINKKIIRQGKFSNKKVNVQSEIEDPSSLLNSVKTFIQLTKRYPEKGHGRYTVVDTDEKSVFVIYYQWADKQLLCACNLSDRPLKFKLNNFQGSKITDIFSDSEYGPVSGAQLSLNGYGYRWLRVSQSR